MRETDPDDRRAFIVRLSKAGKSKFAAYAKENERLVLSLFDDVEPEVVRALMGNLALLKASASRNAAER